MSLLLDALNRASKEKQKAAAAALPPEVPAEPLQWEPVAPAPEPAPEPVVVVSAPAPAVAPKVEWELALEPSPAIAPQPVVQSAPAPAPAPEPEPEPRPVSVVEPSLSSPPVTPAAVAEVPAPALALESAPAPSVANTATPRGAPTLMSKPLPVGQMAQDIRRAYENQPAPSQSGRRRVLALGGLAVGLALAVGSVFLGLWGDPAKILGLSGQSSVAMPANPVASGEVSFAPAPEPVIVANDPPAPVTVKPTVSAKSVAPEVVPTPSPAPAPVAPVSPAATTTAPTNEVVLRGNASIKPAFVAKTRGPGTLEQGYAALLDGRLDEAAQAYGQALRTNPDERDALLGLAYINHQNGRREEAMAYYRKVLRQEPGNAIAIAGLQSLESGTDSTLSASRANELATRQPDSAAAMAMAGNAFVRDGLLADAAQAFARAQALEPSNPLHAYNHAVALDRLGQNAAALAQYERVLGLSATAPAAVRAYQVEAVQLRVQQLRHALATTVPVSP